MLVFYRHCRSTRGLMTLFARKRVITFLDLMKINVLKNMVGGREWQPERDAEHCSAEYLRGDTFSVIDFSFIVFK